MYSFPPSRNLAFALSGAHMPQRRRLSTRLSTAVVWPHARPIFAESRRRSSTTRPVSIYICARSPAVYFEQIASSVREMLTATTAMFGFARCHGPT